MTELTSRGATLWLQPDCSDEIYEIPCSLPDDFTISEGTKTTVYCINSLGKYEATTKTLDAPEDVELTIQSSFDTEANWFDTLVSEGKCDWVIYMSLHCPKRGVFGGWQVVYRFENTEFQSIGVTGLGGDFRADNVLGKTYTMIASPSDVTEIRPYQLVDIPNTAYPYDINAVDFAYDENNCGAGCDDTIAACETMVAAGEDDTSTLQSVTLANRCVQGEIYGTGDISTAILDSVASVVATISGGFVRNVYALNVQLTPGVDIVYTDDGITYTAVPLATAGVAGGPNALFEGPNNKLFLLTSIGEIYVSEDNAISWSQLYDGVAHGSDSLNAGSFFDDITGLVGGDSGHVLFTKNGGESWTESSISQATITGNIISLEWSDEAWLAFTATGEFYYTLIEQDEVINELSVPGATGNTGIDMVVDGCTVWVVYNKAAGSNPGTIVYSINGGRTWELTDAITNTGYNAIAMAGGQPYAVGAGGIIIKATNVKR